MKIREIELQLRIYLPLQSTYFVTWLDTSSYIVSSNVATVLSSAVHGLTVGDIVHLRNVIFPNVITSLTQVAGVGTAVLQDNTDITYPNSETITISGATEADYNGTFNIISISDRETITFEIDFTAPATATGSPILQESNLERYNGLFEVKSTPDTTTFTIDVDGVDFTALSGIQFYNYKNVNIAGDISEESVLDAYTNKDVGEWWMFIVANTSNVSKDKSITTDFDSSHQRGDYYNQQTQESINIYVVVPTQNQITPVDAQDICRNELKRGIIQSLAGYFPNDLFYNSYDGLFYETDSIVTYNTSYYIHSYTFSATVNIAAPDIFVPQSSAIKIIKFNHQDTIYDIKTTDTINLET